MNNFFYDLDSHPESEGQTQPECRASSEIANRKSDNSHPLLQLLQHGCMLEILTCMIVWAEECVVLEALRRGFEDCFGCLEVLDLNEIAIQD